MWCTGQSNSDKFKNCELRRSFEQIAQFQGLQEVVNEW